MTTYYHASPTAITTLRSAPLCVTDDRDAALEYAQGVVYEVSLSGRIADESDVRDVARSVCPDSPYTTAWELLEEECGVREALIADGWDGVEYEDMTPDNAREHVTIAVFDAARSATLVGAL